MLLSFRTARSYYFHTIFFLILASAICGCSKHSRTPNNNLYEVKINDKIVYVEVASTREKRMLGLMYRDKLDKDHGMLFIYPQEQILSFWMKNTKIPLSIAFIGPDGTITQIESMFPKSLISHKSKDKVRYALEMEKGWFKKNNIRAGNKVSFSPEINNINVN